MIVLLFGVTCVGKTAIGQVVSKKLGYQFIDLDLNFKCIYNLTLDELMDEYPDPYERGAFKIGMLHKLIENQNEDTIIAVSPIWYASLIEEVTSLENIISIEMTDTAENIFERLVFADENDVIYTDEAYKQKHKDRYLIEIQDDLDYVVNTYKSIEHKYFVDNKSIEIASDELKYLIETLTKSTG